jgi:hypothetical protein
MGDCVTQLPSDMRMLNNVKTAMLSEEKLVVGEKQV